MPLADHVGVPTQLAEDLGDHPILGRNGPAGIREASCSLSDAGHAVASVVAPGQQARSRGRTESGRVPLRVPDAVRGDLVDVRRLDGPAVAGHRRVPHVIEHDVHDVRRPIGRLGRFERAPIRFRVTDVDVDDAVEWFTHLRHSPSPFAGYPRTPRSLGASAAQNTVLKSRSMLTTVQPLVAAAASAFSAPSS